MRSIKRGLLILLLGSAFNCGCSLVVSRVIAQSEESVKDRSAQRLQEMRVAAQAIKAVDKSEARIPMVSEPVFRFNDAVRGYPDGTVWAWGTKGRPVAIVTISRIGRSASGKKWLYECSALTDEPLSLKSLDGWQWTPGESEFDLRSVSDPPTLADTALRRTRQMKEVAHRFSASEFYTPRGQDKLQSYWLRLLPQPVHQYRDADSGLLEGAIFLFTYGTNPELLLFIECHEDDGAERWYFGVSRCTAARLTLSLDGSEIWQCAKLGGSNPRSSYFCPAGTGKNLVPRQIENDG